MPRGPSGSLPGNWLIVRGIDHLDPVRVRSHEQTDFPGAGGVRELENTIIVGTAARHELRPGIQLNIDLRNGHVQWMGEIEPVGGGADLLVESNQRGFRGAQKRQREGVRRQQVLRGCDLAPSGASDFVPPTCPWVGSPLLYPPTVPPVPGAGAEVESTFSGTSIT